MSSFQYNEKTIAHREKLEKRKKNGGDFYLCADYNLNFDKCFCKLLLIKLSINVRKSPKDTNRQDFEWSDNLT